MVYLKSLLLPIIISSVLFVVEHLIYRENEKSIINNINRNHIIIRMPKMYMIIGIVDIIVFSLFISFSYCVFNESSSWITTITFLLFIMAGILIVFVTIRWRVDVYRDKDYFVVRNLIHKNEYKYSDCIKINMKKNKMVIETIHGLIHIDPCSINIDFLLSMFGKYKIEIIS